MLKTCKPLQVFFFFVSVALVLELWSVLTYGLLFGSLLGGVGVGGRFGHGESPFKGDYGGGKDQFFSMTRSRRVKPSGMYRPVSAAAASVKVATPQASLRES